MWLGAHLNIRLKSKLFFQSLPDIYSKRLNPLPSKLCEALSIVGDGKRYRNKQNIIYANGNSKSPFFCTQMTQQVKIQSSYTSEGK